MLWSWSLDKIFPLHLPHRICALRSWDMALPRLYHCSVRRNIFYQCRDVFKGLRRHWPCCSHEEFTPLFPLKISVRNWAHELPHKCSSTSLLYIYIFLSSFLLFSSLFFLFPPFPSPLVRDFQVCMNFHGHSSIQAFLSCQGCREGALWKPWCPLPQNPWKEEGKQGKGVNVCAEQSVIPGCFSGQDLIQDPWCKLLFHAWLRLQACLQSCCCTSCLCTYWGEACLFTK